MAKVEAYVGHHNLPPNRFEQYSIVPRPRADMFHDAVNTINARNAKTREKRQLSFSVLARTGDIFVYPNGKSLKIAPTDVVVRVVGTSDKDRRSFWREVKKSTKDHSVVKRRK